ncbi:MAG: type VII secretion protein EssB [Eubacteriaceae bacterium]|nr:type VII secretion protein EssB [Eubacteriaceae bacterium]
MEKKITHRISEYGCSGNRLRVLAYENKYFLPCSMEFGDEEVTVTFEEEGVTPWAESGDMTGEEKLRLLCNAEDMEGAAEEFAFSMAPENLFFDMNKVVRAEDRFIKNEAHAMDDREFLLQYKALVGCTLNSEYSFEDYYRGGMDLMGKKKLTAKVAEAETAKEIKSILLEEYKKKVETREKTTTTVDKKKNKRLKRGAVILLAAVIALAVVTVYLLAFNIPEKNRILAADNAFLAQKYDQVIEKMNDVAVGKMSNENKYILGYSYIVSANLTDEQKENAKAGISVSSSEDTLNYWVYLGRADYSNAIDCANRLNSDQLLAYALMNQAEYVKNDSGMSRSAREEKIAEIQAQLDELKVTLNQTTDTTDTTKK